LRFHFEEGKLLAAELVARLQPAQFPTGTSPDVAAWLITERDRLAQDIQGTPLEFTVEDASTCAHTGFSTSAPVTVSVVACRSISTREEAAKLLIHEAAHHLGITDENFADRAAMAVFASFEAAKAKGAVRCPEPGDQRHPISRMLGQLSGTWRPDPQLTRKLGGSFERMPRGFLQFQADEAVLERFRDQAIGRCVFGGGWVTVAARSSQPRKSAYVVVELRGAPVLLMLKPADAPGPAPALRSWALQVIQGQDRGNDLLLFGEKISGESLSAFIRSGT
jgi:hypothetical protein